MLYLNVLDNIKYKVVKIVVAALCIGTHTMIASNPLSYELAIELLAMSYDHRGCISCTCTYVVVVVLVVLY